MSKHRQASCLNLEHNVSAFPRKGVVDGGRPVPEVLPVSWPEHIAMEAGDVVVTVEHCHGCHRHRMTTRHDPEVNTIRISDKRSEACLVAIGERTVGGDDRPGGSVENCRSQRVYFWRGLVGTALALPGVQGRWQLRRRPTVRGEERGLNPEYKGDRRI